MYFPCVSSSKLLKFLKHFIFRRKSLEEIRNLGCEYSEIKHKGLLHILFSGSSIWLFPGFSYFLVKLTVVPKILARIQFSYALDIYLQNIETKFQTTAFLQVFQTREINTSSVSWFHICKSDKKFSLELFSHWLSLWT